MKEPVLTPIQLIFTVIELTILQQILQISDQNSFKMGITTILFFIPTNNIMFPICRKVL